MLPRPFKSLSRTAGQFAARLPAVVLAAFLAGCRPGPGTPPSPGAAPPEAGPPAVVPGKAVAAIRDDPRADGWEIEVESDAALAQLKAVEKLLASPETAAAGDLSAVAAPDFSSEALRPPRLEDAFRDRTFLVRRAGPAGAGPIAPAPDGPAPDGYRGPAGLARALGELAGPLRGARDIHTKFKVFRVEPPPAGAPAGFRTDAYFQASGATGAGGVQLNATWRMTWRRPAAGSPPLLVSLAVEAYEEVVSTARAGLPFADCTEAVLAKNPVFDRQLRPGTDHWTATIEARFGIDVGGWQGAAVGDANGDGLDDLYLCQPGGLPNRLFLQEPDGAAREVSAESGADWLDSTHAALFADLDNDGDQELLLSIEQGILVLENDGAGRFRVGAARPIPAAIPYSLAAADYDEDGDLDVYVACYNPRRGVDRHLVFARPVPYHDANNGGRNSLLRNEGGFRFFDVTRRVGLDVNNRRYSYAATWEDYDGDGDLDLYVANDFGRKNLYRNDGGRFVDVAPQAGVEDIGPGMSAAWGDYDGDGRPDLYVSNMFSSAGNRISHQPQFHSGAGAETRAQFQRHARGNSLFRNLGDGRFEDVSEAAGVVLGRWAWGSLFADLNCDGWQDLVVANGFITQEDPADL